MKAHISPAIKAHVIRSSFYLLLLSGGTVLAFFRPEATAKISKRTLTFAERVAYQRAIEDVYWRHRIWPKDNPDSKPSLDAVMSKAQLENKVANYLRKSQTLADHWQRPITIEQLQAEIDRMAQHTKQPDVLRELFAALGDDPFVIAECFVRPVLSARLVTDRYAHEQGSDGELKRRAESQRKSVETQVPTKVAATDSIAEAIRVNRAYQLPTISGGAECIDDTWTTTSNNNAPSGRWYHTAVWTGSEMIVWGGGNPPTNTGGRYDPTTDSWTATTTANAPSARGGHVAVWTGSEMIIWGSGDAQVAVNTGGRYNPSTDSWVPTSTTNAPPARFDPKGVWTGSEMIVWGGSPPTNTGGRYAPATDSWAATNVTNAPSARDDHTAVWTGSEMIVWGGTDFQNFFDTGGKYNPSTDSWVTTSVTNAPSGRLGPTAVWTGKGMIVWGGEGNVGYLNTGGRYDPDTDSWVATSITDAPAARFFHKAVWTGTEMIIWGGRNNVLWMNSGGRYNASTDSWRPTSPTGAPSVRGQHTAVWTGSEMIVWGGAYFASTGPYLNTGGRYCAATPSPTPTPTATSTPTLTPQPTPTSSRRPCEVTGSQPACDSTVSTEVTDFVVHVSSFIYGSVQPSVFTVNGIPADSGSGGGTAWFFHFNASPVVQGENTMHIPSDAFLCQNGRGVTEFMCTFTYQPSTPTPTAIPTPTPALRYTPTPRPRRTPAPRP